MQRHVPRFGLKIGIPHIQPEITSLKNMHPKYNNCQLESPKKRNDFK